MDISNIKANIEYLRLEEKYELLNRISDLSDLTDEHLDILNTFSYDTGDEIRTQVAEILGNSESIKAETILIRLLEDKNGLVRACSCDSLQLCNSLKIIDILKNMARKDDAYLVRGYAINTIVNILINTNKIEKQYIEFFYDLLKSEKVAWVKIYIYKALYLLGEKSFLYKIIDDLNHKNFKKRAVVANVLCDLITNDNREIIISSLIETLKKEKTTLVKSIIEEGLKGEGYNIL